MTTITETIGGLTITRFPDAPPPTPQDLAMQTIVALETRAHIDSQRLFREAVLRMMEKEAAEIEMTPEQLAVKNKGYRLLKQFDEQIASIRAQL